MQIPDDTEKPKDQSREPHRLPLFVRAGLVAFFLAGAVVALAGGFFWRYHKSVLVGEKFRAAKLNLNLLAATAKIPMLADDSLRLASLVHGAGEIEGVIYASILDREKRVKAFSGQDNLGGEEVPLEFAEVAGKKSGTEIMQYTDPLEGRVYELSTVVVYNEKPLGTAHLRISDTFIQQELIAARSALFQALWGPGLGIFLAFLFLAELYTLSEHRRNKRLRLAIEEYGEGNLQYRIEKIENNETGDLVRSLHSMSEKLLLQEPSDATLEQHLKYSSLDHLLESPLSQEESYAFRRQVTVIFASIKGFGTFSGTEKPENIIKALNTYIRIVTKVISKHGGYVDKVVGDAVVGIFGVSLYHGNHTTRAIQAAIDLQAALSTGNEHESHLLSNVAVGIRSGVVLSGNIGSFSKVEYSSIGESIKEAHWLSSLGQPGEIILGEDVYVQMQDCLLAEPLPPQNMPGTNDPMKCYRLLGSEEKKNDKEP